MSCGGERPIGNCRPRWNSERSTVLSDPVYRGFGPTLAAEYLHKRHQITVSKETCGNGWRRRDCGEPASGGWWRCTNGGRGGAAVASWCSGTPATHDWLEGRGERIYLISMIDDATSRLLARFVRHDSSEENMRLLWAYLERFGRPLAFYTDKAGMFQVAVKTKRQEQREGRDRPEMPPTQIERALRELGIVWIPAHSPQAKAYASYCTSCEPCTTFSGKRRRLASLTPCALRGGLGPGSSYSQSSRSFTG